MKTESEILGGGMYADQIGSNIEVVSRRDALLAMKIYAKAWLDEAAEVAMLQAEKGLPVGDAIYALKDEIDKH